MIIQKFSIVKFYKDKYIEVLPYLKKKNTQAFTMIILTLFALSVFGLFAINPTLSTIANLQKQLDDSQLVDDALTKKITNLSILQRKYLELSNDLSLITTAIPRDPNVPMLVNQVYAIALGSNISPTNLQAFKVELSKAKDGPNKYSSYQFNLSGKGTYDDILQFLSQINNFERIVSIDTIAINKAPLADNKPWQVSLKGETYFKR